ncbi:hypothetical protein ACLOJK_021129 [Asimina triloba]
METTQDEFAGGRRSESPQLMDSAGDSADDDDLLDSIMKELWMDYPSQFQELQLQSTITDPTPADSSTASFCNICLVPYRLQRGHEEAFSCQVITLGLRRLCYSFHRLPDGLEEQKWSYLREALAPDPVRRLGTFLAAIRGSEHAARQCFSGDIVNVDSDRFILTMLLDACFVLQVLLKETRRRPVSPDDPIFRDRLLFHKLKRDLLLLENQIPFVLLQRLYDLIGSPNEGITASLLTVVQEFFRDRIEAASRVDNPKHFLHLLHSNLFPDVDGSKVSAPVADLKPFPTATQLVAAGAEFRSSSADRLDIGFEDGVIRIPRLCIDDDTKSLICNLTACEQLHPSCGSSVAAYTFFMHRLINTVEDVAVLRSKGIISNWLGCDQQVVDLFNELGKNITIRPDEVYLADVIGRIRKYHCSSRSIRSDCGPPLF